MEEVTAACVFAVIPLYGDMCRPRFCVCTCLHLAGICPVFSVCRWLVLWGNRTARDNIRHHWTEYWGRGRYDSRYRARPEQKKKRKKKGRYHLSCTQCGGTLSQLRSAMIVETVVRHIMAVSSRLSTSVSTSIVHDSCGYKERVFAPFSFFMCLYRNFTKTATNRGLFNEPRRGRPVYFPVVSFYANTSRRIFRCKLSVDVDYGRSGLCAGLASLVDDF